MRGMGARRGRGPAVRLVAWLALVVACVCGVARVAYAAPEVTSRISTDEIEAGKEFTIDLSAVTDDGSMPSDPSLETPVGLIAYSPRLGARTDMRSGGGVTIVQKALTATWTVVAEEPGDYTIAAPTVMVNGERLQSGTAFKLHVTPSSRGQLPPPLGGDPGDKLNGDDLKLDKAPDPKLFVRAVPDKTTVFVGEQVTLSYYLYYRVDFKMTDRHEPALADFLRVGLAKNPGAEPAVRARAGTLSFEVRLLDRIAAFPLRAGSIATGALSAKFTGRQIGNGEVRVSNDVVIEVREPPLTARPLGYRIGDVGDYRLSATVEPREIEQGGAVSVRVRLEGTGALPNALRIPQRTGIEWLDPEKRSQDTITSGRVGGYRTFGYVVHVAESGDVDLGAVELPFFKPDGKGGGSYQVARAELGHLRVKPNATAQVPVTDGGPGDDVAPDPFTGIGDARRELGSYEPRSEDVLELPLLAAFVLGPPFAVLSALGLWRGFAALKRRRAARAHDPGALAERAMKETRQATDSKAKAGAIERAIHQAIEAATRLKSRAVLLAVLGDELVKRGVDAELAEETRAVLGECEEVRYVPAGDAATQELVARAERVVKRLLKLAAGSGRPSRSDGADAGTGRASLTSGPTGMPAPPASLPGDGPRAGGER